MRNKQAEYRYKSTKLVKWPSKILSSTAQHQLTKAVWAFCHIKQLYMTH